MMEKYGNHLPKKKEKKKSNIFHAELLLSRHKKIDWSACIHTYKERRKKKKQTQGAANGML